MKMRAVRVGVALLLSGVALSPAPRLRAESHRQSSSRTTRSVTAADGTTTTTITETVTRDGRTTTTTRTVVTGPGQAPSETPGPPEPPATRRPERGQEREREHDDKKGPPPAFDGPALAREAVEAHDRERRRVGTGDLAWDPKLAGLAQSWARHLCRGGKRPPSLEHRPSTSGGPGENLWAGFTTESSRFPIGDAVKSWAGERRFYDERSGRCRGGVCGHYTQLVWRGTKQVGCGVATCPAGAFTATVWVCNYSPAGNVVGEKPY